MKPFAVPYLPDKARLFAYIDRIYARKWLTNNGELHAEFTARLAAHLGVEHLLLVGNGTLALQIAYRALGIAAPACCEPREVITTPFTFVATAASLAWEGCRPVFADIDEHSWCLDPEHVAARITPHTRAIVPVHVFGNACAVERLAAIAEARGLPLVYDGAHAFGVHYRDESLLRYGDATTLSFHATKLFHSIEGGAIVFRRARDHERARRLINFGITGPEQVECVGINAKMTEFQAAMGLAMLDEIEQNLAERRRVGQRYDELIDAGLARPRKRTGCSENYAYYPVAFADRATRDRAHDAIRAAGIVARKYFNPSLDTLSFLNAAHSHCPRARDLAGRVLCLPVHTDMSDDDIGKVAAVINRLA